MQKIALRCLKSKSFIAMQPKNGRKLYIGGEKYTPGAFVAVDGVTDKGIYFGNRCVPWRALESVEPLTTQSFSFPLWELFLAFIFLGILIWLCTH